MEEKYRQIARALTEVRLLWLNCQISSESQREPSKPMARRRNYLRRTPIRARRSDLKSCWLTTITTRLRRCEIISVASDTTSRSFLISEPLASALNKRALICCFVISGYPMAEANIFCKGYERPDTTFQPSLSPVLAPKLTSREAGPPDFTHISPSLSRRNSSSGR